MSQRRLPLTIGVLMALALAGCARGPFVRTIYVADFEPVCTQPEADVMAKKMPDWIADRLRSMRVAEVVSREPLKAPDIVVSGQIIECHPSTGVDRLYYPYTALEVLTEANGKVPGAGAVAFSSHSLVGLGRMADMPLIFQAEFVLLAPLIWAAAGIFTPIGWMMGWRSCPLDLAERRVAEASGGIRRAIRAASR